MLTNAGGKDPHTGTVQRTGKRGQGIRLFRGKQHGIYRHGTSAGQDGQGDLDRTETASLLQAEAGTTEVPLKITETATEVVTVLAETQVQTTISSKKDTAWASAYKKYLIEKYNKQLTKIDEQEYPPFSTFALYYMDDDEIPEVMVTDAGFHYGTATIVTYANGMVKAFSGLGSNGVVYFREKENVIVGDYIGSGMQSIHVYHLDNGSLVTDWESEKHDTTDFEEDGKIAYSTYGANVDEKVYQEQYDRFVPAWYDPMDSGIDACPEKEGILKGWAQLEPKEIEQFFAPWIAK